MMVWSVLKDVEIKTHRRYRTVSDLSFVALQVPNPSGARAFRDTTFQTSWCSVLEVLWAAMSTQGTILDHSWAMLQVVNQAWHCSFFYDAMTTEMVTCRPTKD